MGKYKVISVEEKKYFNVEFEVQGRDRIRITLIEEDGILAPLDRSDVLELRQLKLMDKKTWKELKNQIQKLN